MRCNITYPFNCMLRQRFLALFNVFQKIKATKPLAHVVTEATKASIEIMGYKQSAAFLQATRHGACLFQIFITHLYSITGTHISLRYPLSWCATQHGPWYISDRYALLLDISSCLYQSLLNQPIKYNTAIIVKAEQCFERENLVLEVLRPRGAGL